MIGICLVAIFGFLSVLTYMYSKSIPKPNRGAYEIGTLFLGGIAFLGLCMTLMGV